MESNLVSRLAVSEGRPIVSSITVAEVFEKRHADVQRAIVNLECSDEFRKRNFAFTVESLKIGATTRDQPLYKMTRDGFSFLAMGFTGKKAARWKERFLEAFNAMEAELLKRSSSPASSPFPTGPLFGVPAGSAARHVLSKMAPGTRFSPSQVCASLGLAPGSRDYERASYYIWQLGKRKGVVRKLSWNIYERTSVPLESTLVDDVVLDMLGDRAVPKRRPDVALDREASSVLADSLDELTMASESLAGLASICAKGEGLTLPGVANILRLLSAQVETATTSIDDRVAA